ncbi:MAG: hypothetical protein N2561_08260 [Bacteroidetes bacterium]|nr:hypothetical protein [Rhodothermia bacterium]MCX7907507.1 hypothetical protein [Bacteroidota bacterium]MDW8284562.1 hypothetical protein [Bacteroidota bacterium]
MVPFEALGFHFTGEDDFVDTLGELLEGGRRVPCQKGFYVRWSEAGIELWYGFLHDHTFTGAVIPFFRSPGASLRVRVTQVVEDPEYPLCGFLIGDANALLDVEGVHTGDYPICVQAVDFQCALEALERSRLLRLQVVGFCGDLAFFDRLEDLRSYTQGLGAALLDIAPKSFLPVGLFPEVEGEATPQPIALVGGYLRSLRLLHNPVTGHPFYHLIVDTQGQRLSLLSADPALERAKPPQLLLSTVWLAACTAEEDFPNAFSA